MSSYRGYYPTIRGIPNFGHPDEYSYASMSSEASRTITVSKKPRYVLFICVRNNDTTARGFVTLASVESYKYSKFAYTSEGYKAYTQLDSSSDFVNITDSSVTVKNNYSTTARTFVLIWY